MTTPQPPERPERVAVEPDGSSRLATLLTIYSAQKAELAAAEKAADETKAAIMAELARWPQQPGKAFDIPAHPSGAWGAYALTWSNPNRFQQKDFAEAHPDLYEEFKRPGKGQWSLMPVSNRKQ